MYLKSLTLRGFKSFASTTTLNFEPGITCVVGPNGSGKSNVVDALSWVMGEQGVKSLRGGKMEDVIFAGTSKRAPLGRAEVLLTIDNTDQALPIDYTEVTISRTMFRAGGSEYAINGTPSRLRDVQELLGDSGIGREMHVIVGQGQLDSILNATPETRRGFIEEAAGILKHRQRKERAERRLESTAANLNRLSDLLAEIRRQLKPLGRQAEVARKAATVQAEVLDARARLLADDYVAALTAFETDKAAEEALRAKRARLEDALAQARAAEAAAEAAARAAQPAVNTAQETWYALAGLRERANSQAVIAAERMRNAVNVPEVSGRDPEAIEREAATVRQAVASANEDIRAKQEALAKATAALEAATTAYEAAERVFQAAQRAIADRREGLARLTGEVNTLRSRAESADAEIERLSAAVAAADERSRQAKVAFAALETKLAGLSAGESGLDAEYAAAEEAVAGLKAEIAALEEDERRIASSRAALSARLEALQLGVAKDAEAALLAEPLAGVLGSVAAFISVPKGDEVAISAALGAAADAVAVSGIDHALEALGRLKNEDLGRAGMLLGGAAAQPKDWPPLPAGARYAAEVVKTKPEFRAALDRMLFKVALVADMPAARQLIAELPDITAVTAAGDVLSSWFAAGGSAGKPSLIEVQAAIADGNAELADVQAELERLRFTLAQKHNDLEQASARAEAALARLNESDAAYAALAEEASALNQSGSAAAAESGRLTNAVAAAQEVKASALAALDELEARLERASESTEVLTADPTERDRAGDLATVARGQEMEARLALRTVEERGRALRSRLESLERSAAAERDAQVKAAERAERLRREGIRAQAVAMAVAWLSERVTASIALADQARQAAQARRSDAEAALSQARASGRELAIEFETLVDSVHRDEMSRAQQQMRLDQLAERAMSELGFEPEALVNDYGPEVPIPGEDGPVPFVRAEQERRLRAAERDLGVLGKVNPLALEEFEAMQTRHAYLSEQLEDLRKTRADLLGIIDEVDAHMQQVFAEAYEDVAAQFETCFARLFPGGEGRLTLTEPGMWLTTGVEVEARPAGKKVKRLSLLSGGERSLVAVAFLVALFKARPSPFYILDEVEAALDDVNLGRLLEIYEELRDDSQLLVITHQKRTMEIADALYGVTMGADGVSTVISQRLRE
ncbi:MAG: chromosome segregation protein SMC [Propionibacteriaceae bacterium]|nr:chromosome segregation protein SMC [Propionibacteriaceae bacterium]